MGESAVFLREGAQKSLLLQGLDVLQVNGDLIEMRRSYALRAEETPPFGWLKTR
jgi:hypothetical protein